MSSTPVASKTKPETGSKTDVSTDSANAKDKIVSQDSIDKSDETAKNDTSSSDITKTEDIPKVSEDVKDSDKNAATITEPTPSARGKVWHHVAADCLACARVRPPSSHELRKAYFAGKTLRNY